MNVEMELKMKKAIGPAVVVVALFLLSGCSSLGVPKDFIPDSKVVYLREKIEYGPIRYPPMTVDPYSFAPDTAPIDVEHPGFLQASSFDLFLRADFKADSRLFREIEGHVLNIRDSKLFTEMRAGLDAAVITAPPALPPTHGEKVKDYSNAVQYDYPDAQGASITIFSSGDYEIDFPDSSSFKYFRDGSYLRADASGAELFGFGAKDSMATLRIGDTTYTAGPGYRSASDARGKIEYLASPDPQYQFTPSGSKPGRTYVFFVDGSGNFIEYSCKTEAGLRFDYFADKGGVLVTSGAQAIGIDPDCNKRHMVFDVEKRKTTALLSEYLPEGIRLTSLQGPGLAHAEVTPAWPEGYKSKVIGPFTFLYTAKDEALLSKLDGKHLTEIEAGDRRLSGLGGTPGRTIIIPPDLTSYCRLQATKAGSTLNWWPSGFETEDHIVMWPLSVPRYAASPGQDYFYNQELYEIIAHEYTHLLVGENAGILSPVPVWLNEGLAVFVESRTSPEVKAYWDEAFSVFMAQKRLLNWDEVTVKGTGEFKVAEARVDYAQSYALVEALIEKFGAAKVDEYIRSFRSSPEDLGTIDLQSLYRKNFRSVFGITLDQALGLLQAKSPGA